MALLLVLSSIPGTPRPDEPSSYALFRWVPPRVQNLLHLPEYALLAWLWCRALGATGSGARRKMIGAAVISIAFALLDEAYQMTIPGRYASMTDLLLNAVGVAGGIWLHRAHRDRTANRQ
jgi:VanZ family protein